MIQQVVEQRKNHEHCARNEKSPYNESTDDLPLWSRKEHDKGIQDCRWRIVVEEGGKHGEDIKKWP